MPLKISHKSENEVPTPTSTGKVNQDFEALKAEMQKLASGMVLEIETGSVKAVRSAKTLVTRAANQLGAKWQHWSVGSKVFARPVGEIKKRVGRQKESD
jgi:hypothetical protein